MIMNLSDLHDTFNPSPTSGEQKKCIDCNVHTGKYKRCYTCNIKYKNGGVIPEREPCSQKKCTHCDTIIKGTFKSCYPCHQRIKVAKEGKPCIDCTNTIYSTFPRCNLCHIKNLNANRKPNQKCTDCDSYETGMYTRCHPCNKKRYNMRNLSRPF